MVARTHSAPSSRCGRNSTPICGISSSDAPKIRVATPSVSAGCLRHHPSCLPYTLRTHSKTGLRLSLMPFQREGREHRHQGQRENQRADQGKRHGIGHGTEELPGGARERVDGKITGDDHGDGVKDGAIHIARRGQDHFAKIKSLAVAGAEFTVNVLHHDDGAVDDDAEINGSDGEQIGGIAAGVQENKREQERQRNGERRNQGGAHAAQEEDEDDQHQQHSAHEIAFHRVGGDADQVAAIVEGRTFTSGGRIDWFSSSVFFSTPLSTFWVCSPRRMRITPSTASSFFSNPKIPSRGRGRSPRGRCP